MNQKVEQALIDYSNDVWDRAMKAGAVAEQERIIKLLEENVQNNNLNDLLTPKLIALIKGEK
jgi:hypothetical protein